MTRGESSAAPPLNSAKRPLRLRRHEQVHILFSDIVGFTAMAAELNPPELMALLNELFGKFDQIAEHLQLYKVETIGDAYMVVAGLPFMHCQMRPADALAEMALLMHAATRTVSRPLRIRVGMHTGMVCAGTLGLKMPHCARGRRLAS